MSPNIHKQERGVTSSPFRFQSFSGDQEQVQVFEKPPGVEDDVFLETSPSGRMSDESMQQVLQATQQEVSALLAEARERASRLEKEGYEKGLAEGRKTGELLAQQALEPTLSAFSATIADLYTLKERYIHAIQLDVLDVVLAATEKIIDRELQTHPKVILDLIKANLRQVKEKEDMTLFLSPSDFDWVQQQGTTLGVRLEVDTDLSRGSMMIRSRYGDTDCSLNTQLDLMKQAISRSVLKGDGLA
jgi:flagellar assembly protein FliH